MYPRISFVTLVVRDLDRSRDFYIERLGWTAELDVPGEVVMIRTGEKLGRSLWQEDAAVTELWPIRRSDGALPFTLAHNVGSPRQWTPCWHQQGTRGPGSSRTPSPGNGVGTPDTSLIRTASGGRSRTTRVPSGSQSSEACPARHPGEFSIGLASGGTNWRPLQQSVRNARRRGGTGRAESTPQALRLR